MTQVRAHTRDIVTVVGSVAVLMLTFVVLVSRSPALVASPELLSLEGFSTHAVPSNLTLTSANAQTDGSFGYSVAIGSTTVVVGAPFENVSGYGDAGHVYIFNATTGKRVHILTSPNAQVFGYFGWSVAISGTTVVVGAFYEDASGHVAAGHVYVYNATTGKRAHMLTSPSPQSYGGFGSSVAISGTTIVVGAPDEEGSAGIDEGRAYVFNATTGALVAKLKSPNPQSGAVFGNSVAIAGTTVVIGAPDETVSGDLDVGQAYVFNSTTGALIVKLKNPNVQTNGYFGGAVAIGGTTVVVGAFNETGAGYNYSGQAYIFKATTGKLVHTLSSPKSQISGGFGYSVAISGRTIVVGAPFETASGYNYSGQAYVFKATTGALVSTLTSPNAQIGGHFGWSISMSGTKVAVGAVEESVLGYVGAGHAYVFKE